MKRIKLPLSAQIFISLVLSIIFGLVFPAKVHYFSWIGELFINLLKLTSIPLILFSVISGIAKLQNSENIRRIGLKTISFYVITSLLSLFTGLILVNIFYPGNGFAMNKNLQVDEILQTATTFRKLVVNFIPSDIYGIFNGENSLLLIFLFSLLFGFFLTKATEKHKSILTGFFNSSLDVMLRIVQFIIKFTPIGFFCIFSKVVSDNNDIFQTFLQSVNYILTLICGLIIIFIFILPVILGILGKLNPFLYFKKVSTALISSFATSSSIASLPVTYESLRTNVGISNRITSFTLPLGTAINKSGLAFYVCVSTIFISQVYGIELSFFDQIIVVFASFLASIIVAPIPKSGIIMLTIVLTTVGLPLEGIGLILFADVIFEMLFTSLNVWSDCCIAAIVAKSEGEALKI